MQQLLAIVGGLVGLYLIVLFFVSLGSRQFMSNRVLIENPAAVAAVITIIIIPIIAWQQYFGRDAGFAFVVLLLACFLGWLVWGALSERK